MQTTNLNVGEWVMGMSTPVLQELCYIAIFTQWTRVHRFIENPAGYL